jgi:uncharacterized protein (TIGR01319 family)
MKAYIDIGSTILKFALINNQGSILSQAFYERSYEEKITTQLDRVLAEHRKKSQIDAIRICSSANGGLRVGVLGLTNTFSISIVANLALSAGANVVVRDVFNELKIGPPIELDVLIVTGGIDCSNMKQLGNKVQRLNLANYQFQSLIYAGNKYLFESFKSIFPNSKAVDNPMGTDLSLSSEKLIDVLRLSYIEDLVDRKGIEELHKISEVPIWPTPGVVNLAFEAAFSSSLGAIYPTPFLVIDIGGATTDVHFGLECLSETTALRPGTFRNSNRHVFAELGVFASKASTEIALKSHERFFDLLEVIYEENASNKYAEFTEYEMDKDFLFVACFFLALDALYFNRNEMVPNLNFSKISSIVITGGASQSANIVWLQAVIDMFLSENSKRSIRIIFDTNYDMWTYGLEKVSPI